MWFSAPPLLDFLNRRFVSDDRWICWLGAALALAGIFFAIWARATIGRNWSAEVQIKQEHQLIRSGPLRPHTASDLHRNSHRSSWFRAGDRRISCAVRALIVGFLGFARKAKTEEAFLAAQFGPAFARTSSVTPAFSSLVSTETSKIGRFNAGFASSLLCFRTIFRANSQHFQNACAIMGTSESHRSS